jgi:hypoxanthine phosphoribosyltransferase
VKPSTSPFHCELVPLDTVYELAFELSQSVRAAGFRPDLVVAIARGGFVPARFVCDFLGCAELASVAIRHYEAGAKRREAARVVHPLAAEVEGRHVLVVDDVNDSGDTLLLAREHVLSRGAAELRLAVLHEKSGSPVRADFHARELREWRWLVYPWAVVEDVSGFVGRMEPSPRSREEALRRLREEFGLAIDAAQWERVVACQPTWTTAPDGGRRTA